MEYKADRSMATLKQYVFFGKWAQFVAIITFSNSPKSVLGEHQGSSREGENYV